MKNFQKELEKLSKKFDGVEVLPLESTSDLVREAASVIAYFDMKGKFKEEICRNCNKVFAFSYYLSTVKCCSIPCMDAVLRSIGLTWDPHAPLSRRWGRYVPAIVPATVLELIAELEESPKEKTPPALSSETEALISEFNKFI